MDRWRERQFDGWLELVAHLLSTRIDDLPRTELLHRLTDTFECPVAFNSVRPDGSIDEVQTLGLRRPLSEDEWAWWRREGRLHHPLVQWHLRTGDLTAQSLGRVPRAFLPPTDTGRLVARLQDLEVEQQISMPCRAGVQSWTFVLGRSGPDFSDQELALARRIQALLALVTRQVSLRPPEPDRAADADLLTARERAVLLLMADGLTASSIGRRLGMSPRTVQKHLEHVYRKLGVNDRLRAYRAAQEAGLVPRQPPR